MFTGALQLLPRDLAVVILSLVSCRCRQILEGICYVPREERRCTLCWLKRAVFDTLRQILMHVVAMTLGFHWMQCIPVRPS